MRLILPLSGLMFLTAFGVAEAKPSAMPNMVFLSMFCRRFLPGGRSRMRETVFAVIRLMATPI